MPSIEGSWQSTSEAGADHVPVGLAAVWVMTLDPKPPTNTCSIDPEFGSVATDEIHGPDLSPVVTASIGSRLVVHFAPPRKSCKAPVAPTRARMQSLMRNPPGFGQPHTYAVPSETAAELPRSRLVGNAMALGP